jgi:predicted negative regulator of RcsB-dependent stress response
MESDVTQHAFFYKAWGWAEDNKKQLVVGAVVVAAIGLIGGFIVWQRGEKENDANAQLSQTLTRVTPTPMSAEELLKVAADNPDTSAGQRAMLLAAGHLFGEGKFVEAYAQFDKYLQQYPETAFTGQALLGMAACLDGQGKTNEAVTAYKNIAEHRPTENVAPQARFALARLYEAQGNLRDALELYGSLGQTRRNTSLGDEAAVRAHEMMIKHPELAPKPDALPMSSIPTTPTPAPAPRPTTPAPAASATNH